MSEPIFVSGDWLVEDLDPTTKARYAFGFEVAEVTGRYSYGVEFAVTREVAEAIVAWQAKFNADGYTGADTLTWDGNVIVQECPENDPDYEGRYAPDGRGLYRVGFGWVWFVVDPAECNEVIRQDDTPIYHHLTATRRAA